MKKPVRISGFCNRLRNWVRARVWEIGRAVRFRLALLGDAIDENWRRLWRKLGDWHFSRMGTDGDDDFNPLSMYQPRMVVHRLVRDLPAIIRRHRDEIEEVVLHDWYSEEFYGMPAGFSWAENADRRFDARENEHAERFCGRDVVSFCERDKDGRVVPGRGFDSDGNYVGGVNTGGVAMSDMEEETRATYDFLLESGIKPVVFGSGNRAFCRGRKEGEE